MINCEKTRSQFNTIRDVCFIWDWQYITPNDFKKPHKLLFLTIYFSRYYNYCYCYYYFDTIKSSVP